MRALRWLVHLGSSRRPRMSPCARSTLPGIKESRQPPRTEKSRPSENRPYRGLPLMDEAMLRKAAYAMPLNNPSYPPGPYRFIDREYMIITYRTDNDALQRIVPRPLEVMEPIVKYEFIRMPDSTGFGDYTESGQVIPVRLGGEVGGYVHAMFLNDHPPIAGGRELWGFPKKLAKPCLEVDRDTLVGTLDYGRVRIATGTMGYKHRGLDRRRSSFIPTRSRRLRIFQSGKSSLPRT